jgi:TRAP-type uncharacterized transport system substrate-binding protein
MTIRLDPKLYAYVKQQAPDNKSRFLEELVRKHSLDNLQDDVVARITAAIINNPEFIAAVSSKLENKQKNEDAERQAVLDAIPDF